MCLLLAFRVTPAHADWYRADSDHFVVYADDNIKDVTAFTRLLERFHSALSLSTTAQTLPPPSPSNRVTIFIVRNEATVRKLLADGNRYVGGFYVPRAGQSIAIVPSVNVGSAVAHGALLNLLHEYAHHFFYSVSAFPMPRWLSEGSAEFFSSASFEPDGAVMIGRPARHRGGELLYAVDVKAEELLDSDVYEAKKEKSSGYDAFYGKSWLLYHYLSFEPERRGQLQQYIRLMVAGKSSREAALATFGPFDDLDKDLASYLKRFKMSALSIPHEKISEGPVALRPLTAGEAAMMPIMTQSKVGVTSEQAQEIVTDARAIAAKYPSDAAVLAMLAENEFDAGNNDAAISAADAALALDPGRVNAYVQKGYALFAKAAKSDDRKKAFETAVRPFIALNHLEPDHPLPLIYFYRSFAERAAPPSPLAIQGLQRAAELAPFDLGLKMMVANQDIRDGRFADARLHLKPVAYNPHGGELAQAAKALLDEIDAKPDATGNGARR